MACHIRKNDVVVVIAGDHKGERGKVLRVDARRERVVVEGINMIYRHVKPTRRNPQGGRVQKEAALHISNVLPLDTKVGRGSRVHRAVEWRSSGHVSAKRRVTVKGTVLGDITRASRGVEAATS